LDCSSDTGDHGLCLVVAYDGTEFAGYQVQPEQRTVQRELERAIQTLTGHAARTRAAGRTDAGVHALGQIVAFESKRLIPPRGWLLGLNRALPADVRVQRATPCPAWYAPRHEATEKTYRYVLQLGDVQNPLLRHRAYHVAKMRNLDFALMRQAAALLVGTHDYRAFRSSDDARENAVRTLYAIDVVERYQGDPTLIAIEVRGTAFMKNMVRILAGTLMDVARGRIALDRVPTLLGPSAQREAAGQTAPAHGLTLVNVELGRHTPSPLAVD
jgi:tRNA pseudouridine38-40 synthase